MLHLLRAAAKTWVFRGLFALLIVSFAVWGIGDLSFGGAGTRVIQAGDERVTVEEYYQQVRKTAVKSHCIGWQLHCFSPPCALIVISIDWTCRTGWLTGGLYHVCGPH